jgi:DNA-binding beta-propeller fold protein YncE
MSAFFRLVALAALVVSIGMSKPRATEAQTPLLLERVIPLQDVSGRIDHMAVDLGRKRLFVAELGNGSVDVVDLASGKAIHRISGLREPQGVGYAAQADIVVAANAGDGTVRVFRAEDFASLDSIALGGDADNVRIDPSTGNLVIGYGSGGLAVIDPNRRAKVADIPLPGHPEGFQIDPDTRRAFVNIPDASRIVVADLTARRVSHSVPLQGAGGNFPIALDRKLGLLAVVFRNPPKLALRDSRRIAVQGEQRVCGDADDVFFDDRRSKVYVSCGGGEIAVFEVDQAATLRMLPSIKTASGARTSLFVPELDRLFVARRAGLLGSDAAILVYRPEPPDG